MPHFFPAFEVGKSPHPKKRVLIFNREKGTKDFHADFLMLGDGFGFKDFEKFGSLARFDFVSAHFDEHKKREHTLPASSIQQHCRIVCN
jgi:hypothetical protein